MRGTAIERFQRFTKTGDGCWLWRGTLVGGYGQFWDQGRKGYAARWAYEHWRGPVPAGLTIDHLCRIRACVNPWHLEPVTLAENISRAVAFREPRTRCRRGHKYYVTPLTGLRYCRTCLGRTAKLSS
jgi:hypothetical protein